MNAKIRLILEDIHLDISMKPFNIGDVTGDT